MKLASALLFVLLLCSGAVRATAFSTDQSDLWWVPAESGWGIQFTQRGQMIFATMYVHRPDGSAVWYTGLMNPTLLPATWSGDLYVTDGPWFGTSSYNPASVVNRQVGTISWYAQSGDSGSLTYSVDGVSVSKTIQRFSLTLDDFTGSFLGGYSRTSSGCFNSANNVTLDSGGIVTVTQNGQNATVTAPGGSCTFTGPLTQSGQFGRIDGTYTCTGGDNGSAALFEMNVGISAFSARVLAISSSLGCITSGNIGGVRRR